MENLPMTPSTVPDFFQEETEAARREQVGWLMRVVGVDDSFFGHLLRTDPATFGAWRTSRAFLSAEDEQTLRELWDTTLHLLSFLGFQEDRVRDLFQGFLPAPRRGEGSPLAPPWRGTTLRDFLETGGLEAIYQVDRWVTGLRFGDPYAA
jgi:hypothetical protein